MNETQYKNYLKAEGIDKYITEFVDTPFLLIDQATGENLDIDKNQEHIKTREPVQIVTRKFKDEEEMKSHLQSLDKCYVLPTDPLMGNHKRIMRFYGWNKS